MAHPMIHLLTYLSELLWRFLTWVAGEEEYLDRWEDPNA